jgi:hypothetical protein
MAIEFGTGLTGAAATALYGRTAPVRRQDGQSNNPFRNQQEDEPTPRAGFGNGTISTISAASATLDTNLESARQLVPTLEEASAEARARTEAARQRLEEAGEREVIRLDETSQRNENASRAQIQFFEQTERTQNPFVPRETTPQATAREVESVATLVIPEPATQFDTFG